MVNLPDGYFGPEQINLYRSLIELLPDNATIVELGVWQGRSLCSIANIVKRKNISVYAVDTFEGTPGEPGDELINIAKNKNILTTFQDNLKQFDLESNVTILKGRTDEMHEYVGAKSLDLVFIDAGHDYQSVSTDISLWLPKVKDSGILVGHDYSATFPDVEKAVKERFGLDFAVNTEMWIHYKPQANRLSLKADATPVRPPIKQGRPTVAAEISTKDRYNTTLPLAIYAIASQTVKVDKLVIFDDGEQIDLRAVPLYAHLFALLQRKGIPWFVNFGNKTGQVANHNMMIQVAGTDWIWRVDDDDAPEPDCLEKLMRHIAPDVGAVGGVVWTPEVPPSPENQSSSMIADLYTAFNLQWSQFKGVREVEHLHNTFIFRTEAAKHGYCRELSPVGHREETLFSYEIKRAGWRMLVDPEAVTWHLRDPNGGIRSHTAEENYQRDEEVFAKKMAAFNVKPDQFQLVVLDNGIGDHFMFKMILPELKKKYGDSRPVLAVCYPEVFEGEDVDIISLAEAKAIEPNIEKYSIYRWCIDNNWTGSLVDAFRKMYL